MIAGSARAGRDSSPGPNYFGPAGCALAFTLCAVAFMLAGCSAQNFTPAPASSSNYYTPRYYGGTRSEVASWYGPGFAGRPTSTGDIYNPEGLTAASRTLPLGSHAVVTNPDTGRSVVVRINDRGPFVRGRSLDLSHGAAREIGLTGKGVGRVEVTPTARSTPAPAYAESSVVAEPRNLSYISYHPRRTYVAPSPHHHYAYRRSHHYSSRRIVSNPIGAWLESALPRL